MFWTKKVRAFSLLGAENLFYLDFIDEKEGAISCGSRVPFGNAVFGHSVHLDKACGAAGEVERVAGDAVAVGFGERRQVAFGHGGPLVSRRPTRQYLYGAHRRSNCPFPRRC